MTKRSQRRRSEGSCIWSLFSGFDFRHGRSSRRLLDDTRPENKKTAGTQKVLPQRTEKCQNVVLDGAVKLKSRVKELIAIEMLNEQGTETHSYDSEVVSDQIGFKYENFMKRRNNKCLRSIDIDVSEFDTVECLPENFVQAPEQKPLDNVDMEAAIEELARITQINNVHDTRDQNVRVVEDQLVAQLKMFIEERLKSSKHFRERGSVFLSDEFMRALRISDFNADFFSELLEDQNSAIVNQIQNLEDGQVDKNQEPSSLLASQEKPENSKSNELSNPKLKSFLRRRKLLKSNPLGGDKVCLPPNTIVLLKPGSAQNSGIDIDMSSVSVQSNCPRLDESNIYIEAKKHLSDILNNGEEQAESNSKQLPKYLGGILSLPEVNGTLSSGTKKCGDHIFINPQMRLPPCGVTENNSEILLGTDMNNPTSRKQNLDCQPCIISSGNSVDEVQSSNMSSSCQLKHDLNSLDDRCFSKDAIAPEAVVEIEEKNQLRSCEDENIINFSSESPRNSLTRDPGEGDSREVDNEGTTSQLTKQSFPSELLCKQIPLSPTVSPLQSPVSTIDKMGRSSPVSILEPLLTDDEISPSSIISQPEDKDIRPQHIHFEEQCYPMESVACTGISLDGEESAFEYVEAVLLGSGLNWDEFISRWLSSYEILDSSLFDEVELFSSRPRDDQRLLFDCSSEALKEVCGIYFGWVNVKTNIQAVPRGMDLIHEIWKRVEKCVYQRPQQHSLAQLIRVDMERSRNWIKLQSYMEFISCELEETIFSELVEEFVQNSAIVWTP